MAYYASTQYAGSFPPVPYQPTGLASYGGPYRVNQPLYYAGPSYSTTSDNDFQFGPVCAPGYSTFNAPSSYNMGNYGMPAYSPENCSYYPYYQQQQPPMMQPTFSQQPTVSLQPQQHAQSMSQHSIQQTHSLAESQGSPVTQVDDMSQLAPQIEAAYQAASGQRRQPVIKRQVITVPGQPARVQQVVRRLPTPTPDIIERVFVVKPHRDIVNLVIERPCTPPAQFKDKTIYGKPRRPIINPRIVRVSPRHQYQLPPASPGMYQIGSSASPQQLPYSSSYQFQPNQASISQAQFSQASQTQIPPAQSSQTQMVSPQQPKGYLIAPVQYEDANYNVQTTSINYVPPTTLSYTIPAPAISPVPMVVAPAPTAPMYGPGLAGGPTSVASMPVCLGTGMASPSYYAATAGYPTPYGARVF